MKVLTAEQVPSNKKERIIGGVYIEFETSENVNKDDYFKIKVNDKNYDFQAVGIKVNGENFLINAKEVGYWATTLESNNVNLKSIIGSEVIAVTDESEKKDIYIRSCWC